MCIRDSSDIIFRYVPLLSRLLPCRPQGRIAHTRLLLRILGDYRGIIHCVIHIVDGVLRCCLRALACRRVAHGGYHYILYILID